MREEKIEGNCTHYFEYSHKEQQPLDYGTVNYREVDVVICKKCGEVRRV